MYPKNIYHFSMDFKKFRGLSKITVPGIIDIYNNNFETIIQLKCILFMLFLLKIYEPAAVFLIKL